MTDSLFLGALFDMDGLLLDSERLLLECARAIGLEMQLGDLREPLLSLTGVREAEAKARLAPLIGSSATMRAYEMAVSERYQQALTSHLVLKPTVRELLETLRRQGTPCAVATSSRRSHAIDLLSQVGLIEFFVSVTGGDQVIRPKPNPEIYQLAAKSLGIEPVNAAAFEDSDPGTRAAIASGATVVQVPDLVQPSSTLALLGHCIAPDVLSGARSVGLVA